MNATPPDDPAVTVAVSGTATLNGGGSGWQRLGGNPTERMLALITACLLLVAIIAALAVAGLSLHASDQQSAANSRQIAELNGSILAARGVTSEKLACDQRFENAVTHSFRVYQAAIGDLIELNITGQTTGLDAAGAQMGTDLATYRALADQLADYIDAGRPQPCPLTP